MSEFITHKPFAVSGSEAIQLLKEIMRGSAAATGVGIVMLLWSGIQAFVGLEKAFDMMWNCTPRRFLHRTLTGFGILITTGTLLMISVGITAAIHAIEHIHLQINVQNALLLIGWAEKLSATALSFVIAALTFTIIYKATPNRAMPLKPSAVGGLTAAALWEAANQAFGFYLTHFTRISTVYGSLGTVIVLMLWIYCSAVVVMLGAETAAVYEARISSTFRRRH